MFAICLLVFIVPLLQDVLSGRAAELGPAHIANSILQAFLDRLALVPGSPGYSKNVVYFPSSVIHLMLDCHPSHQAELPTVSAEVNHVASKLA